MGKTSDLRYGFSDPRDFGTELETLCTLELWKSQNPKDREKVLEFLKDAMSLQFDDQQVQGVWLGYFRVKITE